MGETIVIREGKLLVPKVKRLYISEWKHFPGGWRRNPEVNAELFELIGILIIFIGEFRQKYDSLSAERGICF